MEQIPACPETTAPSLLLTAPEDLNVVAWKTVHGLCGRQKANMWQWHWKGKC